MDTIYTEWSCMAAALTAGMTLMLVYDGLRLFRLFVSHAPIWTGLEPGCPFFSCSAAGTRGKCGFI